MPLYRAAERWIIARLEIDLMNVQRRGRLPRDDIELLIISDAVLIGHVEHRPRNATEIGRYLSIPRPTVQRKLAILCELGICERVDGRRFIMATRWKPGDDYSYIDQALSLIRDAAHKSAALTR